MSILREYYDSVLAEELETFSPFDSASFDKAMIRVKNLRKCTISSLETCRDLVATWTKASIAPADTSATVSDFPPLPVPAESDGLNARTCRRRL